MENEVPQRLEAHVAPHTLAILKLIAEVQEVGSETIAASILDQFARHYSDLVVTGYETITEERIDNASQNIHPKDP